MRRGIHRGQVEGVIQDAGVEAPDWHRRRRVQTDVVGDVGQEVGADSQQGWGIGYALTRANACATAMRVLASSGKEMSSGLAGLPRAGPVLGSEGGSRISTSPRVAEHGLCAEAVASVTYMSMRRTDLVADKQEQCGSWADPGCAGLDPPDLGSPGSLPPR